MTGVSCFGVVTNGGDFCFSSCKGGGGGHGKKGGLMDLMNHKKRKAAFLAIFVVYDGVSSARLFYLLLILYYLVYDTHEKHCLLWAEGVLKAKSSTAARASVVSR